MRWIWLAAVVVVVAVALLVFARNPGPGPAPAGESDPATAAPDDDGTASSVAGETPATTGSVNPPSAGGYEPRFDEATCQFEVPSGQSPECGYLVVPQDRDDPNGRQVRIHVATFRATGPDPAPDPVVYLEGGPGGEALEVLNLSFDDRFGPFLETRDVIIFDQRGTGFSEPSLACAEYRELGFDLLDEVLEPEESLAREYDVLAQCRDEYIADDVDLSEYHSAASAADVADLRRALGIGEWNLYGISYGTRLALTIMRDHPDGVRSVILDSVYPPEVDGIANIPRNAERAFGVLFAGCAADAGCNAAYPDLERRFFALVDTADAEPISVDVIDFFSGDRYEAVLDGSDLLGVVFQSLYSETIIPTIPGLIAQIETGEYRDLGNLVSLFVANGEFFSVGMHASVQCAEEIPFSNPGATATAAETFPYLGRITEGSITQSPQAREFCELWGTQPQPALEDEPVSSGIPTLVMAGEYDPITPPGDGRAVAERLSQASYVEFPGLGHAVSTAADCSTSITLAFLDTPGAPVDTSCVGEMGGPDFEVPGETVEVGALVPFEDSSAGISGVVPADWESVGFGSHARQASALDQTALIQQAVPGGSRDLVLTLLASQLGLEDPEPFAEVDAGGRRWTRYEGEIQGFVADIALADADGLTYLVVLVSDPEERDGLVDQVLVPVLEAIQST